MGNYVRADLGNYVSDNLSDLGISRAPTVEGGHAGGPADAALALTRRILGDDA
jgi:hypothetical protein